METQSRAFSDLAAKPAIFDPADATALEDLTHITAEATGMRRVSVWQWQFGGRQLVCDDCYDRESGGHTRGAVLLQEDLPQLFEALLGEETLSAEDAAQDPRTAELHRVYLDRLGCHGLLAAPVFDDDDNRGTLWFEHEDRQHRWRPEDRAFARAVAGLLALRLSAAQGRAVCPTAGGTEMAVETASAAAAAPKRQAAIEDPGPVAHADPAMRQATIVELRSQAFRKAISQRAASPGAIGADVFEDVSVLVLLFPDPIALAERIGDQKPTTAVERLIRRLEELGSASGVEYMKFMSDQLVCAAGFREGGTVDHPVIVAELALQIQDACLGLFEKSRTTLDFKIGIDTGGVIGSAVGQERQTYNLWGAAVVTAGVMAESGTMGEIHVSESTYRRLQTGYLFKVRGHYYLPDVGELSTYILTGHL
jgi:class 3 adenylate cyclase